MQNEALLNKKRIIIILAIVFVVVGVVTLIWFLMQKDTNQFGKFIKIQNYSSKVKNLPSSVQDATQSYLYNVVVLNVDKSVQPEKIPDANIRDSSDSQVFEKNIYKGKYIVDIASIKQSYQVEYTYNRDPNVIYGNPIVVSCLPKEKLIYGEFNCKDIVSSQSNKEDPIMRYLPYQSYSFSIRPDTTQGSLILNVNLTIPDMDLKGTTESKTKTIARYKNDVQQWIKSKNLDPANYTLKYNYDDAGNALNQTKLGD